MNNNSSLPNFLVFLDFDGVLHPFNACEHERFKPEAIHHVNHILDELDASVVLSTAWRMHCDIDEFNAWFQHRIIGSTPIHDWNIEQESLRFHEVLDFLTSRKWLHIPWLAIDDKRRHFPVDSPAYITDAKIGITANDVDNIIMIGRSMKFARRSLLEHLSRRGYANAINRPIKF